MPSLPTTPTTVGVHRSLLPEVFKLRKHAKRGGGGVDPTHCVTQTFWCDTKVTLFVTNKLLWMSAPCVALCRQYAPQMSQFVRQICRSSAETLPEQKKAPRDRHSSDSFWLIWSYQKKTRNRHRCLNTSWKSAELIYHRISWCADKDYVIASTASMYRYFVNSLSLLSSK